MIQEKFYTEKEGRDPSIYLGIDQSPIPFEYVKGMYSDAGNIYTDNSMWGDIQFLVTEDEKSLLLISTNPDSYVTKEDLESTDQWYKIGHSLPTYETTFSSFRSIQESLKDDPWYGLLERYHNGETGLLEYDEKKYNDKGEYMRVHKAFDTRPREETVDIRDTLRRHVSFVYVFDQHILPQDRHMIVRSNTHNIMQLLSIEVKPQIETLVNNGLLKISDDQESKFQFIVIPYLGKLQLEFDEDIEDFLVIRLDNK